MDRRLVCEECARLLTSYLDARERLLATQRELASYKEAEDKDAFARTWEDCLKDLKALSGLREQMATHAASHVEP